ncbi:NAD-dependent epimerase/dehydratase family protein [Microcoleus sp. AR_TQ3_B6]|uniref:NAD-dependent epimerase/dehydratase family protein n=1 Tax=Microcoleus sp. AR_TQ3_B6 TaxID=3055284 RepID=UPI002FD77C5F
MNLVGCLIYFSAFRFERSRWHIPTFPRPKMRSGCTPRQAGLRYSLQNPHACADSNLTGFINILEGCRPSKIEHLVFASSSSVYGTNTKVQFAVSDNVDRAISRYAATKKAKELMAHSYSHLYNLSITGLRFFTVDLLHKSLLDTKTADVRQINTD